MTTVEDRLTAALAARADLVQPEHLRAPGLPPPSAARWRRPATYALAAAAAAAAIALPFLVPGERSADPAPGTETPSPSEDAAPDGRLLRTALFDVDGDGVDDEVTIHAVRPAAAGEIRVEVAPGGGGDPVWIQLRAPQIDVRLLHVDADADGSEEIVVADYLGVRALRMVDLVGGALQPVELPDGPPLTDAFAREGRVQRWWIDEDGLFSTRSVDVLAVSEHYVPLPEQYAVDFWSWTLADGMLTPSDLGRACVEAEAPQQPFPC
jgi:hypothetical protein